MEADVGWVVGGDEEVPPRRARREVEERVRGGAGPGRCDPGWAGGWGSGRAPAGPAREEKAGAVHGRAALGRRGPTSFGLQGASAAGVHLRRTPSAYSGVVVVVPSGRSGRRQGCRSQPPPRPSSRAPVTKPGRTLRRARAGRERKGWDGKRREGLKVGGRHEAGGAGGARVGGEAARATA